MKLRLSPEAVSRMLRSRVVITHVSELIYLLGPLMLAKPARILKLALLVLGKGVKQKREPTLTSWKLEGGRKPTLTPPTTVTELLYAYLLFQALVFRHWPRKSIFLLFSLCLSKMSLTVKLFERVL